MGPSARTIVGESSDAPVASRVDESAHAPELRVGRVSSTRVRFPTVSGCVTSAVQPLCVQISCRYHLAHPDRDGRPLSATRDCALAVANEGPHTLEEIAQVLGLTRERVRQIEDSAIIKLRGKAALKRLHDTIG
jgi:hypothetical protein